MKTGLIIADCILGTISVWNLVGLFVDEYQAKKRIEASKRFVEEIVKKETK